MMKKFLLSLLLLPFCSVGQYSYTVTVTKLMAKADDCDGAIAPLCLGASEQDPTFNLWCMDGGGNENTNCWNFEDDPTIDFGTWKDILDVQIGSEANVNTSYIRIEMGGFESDQLFTSCSSTFGDDEIIDRTLAQEFPLSSLTEGIVNTVQVNIGDIYYAELEIEWHDLYAGITELNQGISFTVVPNPSNGIFALKFNDETTNSYSVKVMDMVGRVIFEQSEINTTESIDLSNNEAGKYFVYVEINGAVKIQSIIIQ